MSNPYETPEAEMVSPGEDGALPLPQEPGMVGHVRIVSVLMMVQGGLLLLAGLGLAGMGVFMPVIMNNAMMENPEFQQGQGPGASPEFPFEMMFWIYGGMGLVIGSLGAFIIYAGIRNWKFKSRTLGIVALAVGFGAVFTCYCGPTAIGLGIYGLIAYLNPSSAAAFRMGEAGYSGDAIIATFSRTRHEQSQYMP